MTPLTPEQREAFIIATARDAVVAAAGPVAQRRCMRTVTPGYKRFRTYLEQVAFHECGHVVARALSHEIPFKVTVAGPELPVTGGRTSTAYVLSTKPENESNPTGGRASMTDAEKLRHDVRIIALSGRAPLSIIREIRRTATDLIDSKWSLVCVLARELATRQTLYHNDIEKLLAPHLRATERSPDLFAVSGT